MPSACFLRERHFSEALWPLSDKLDTLFDRDAMLMSNRLARLMIYLSSKCCLLLIAFAVSTNSCAIIGSTCILLACEDA